MKVFAGQEWRHRCRARTCRQSAGEGEGGMNCENSTDIYTPLLSRFSRVRLCETPETTAHQAPPSLVLQARTLEWVAISFSYHLWNGQQAGSCSVVQGAQLGALWWPGGMGWDGGREAQEWEEICIFMADPHCCTAETNTILNRWGNSGNSVRLYFFGLQNHCRWWLQPWN